ncbi:MAG: CBS domain-containing protein [Bacteroidota bacterium]
MFRKNNSPFQVMEKFRESQIHSCFIVDEYGSILGMITLNDILKPLLVKFHSLTWKTMK